MFVARGPDAFPVIQWRDEGGGTKRFGNYGGNVAFTFEHILDVIRASQIAGRAALEGAVAVVWRRYMFAARQQRTDAATEGGFAAYRDRVQGSAVKGFPHGNEFETPGR